MKWWQFGGVIVAALVLPASVNAQSVSSKGLAVAPARQFATVASGQQQVKSLQVGNYTASPMDISLSVHRFSVADLSYDFNFYDAQDDWIKPDTPLLRLEPGKSQTIRFQIAVPAGSAPGGRYYGLFATAAGQPDNDRQQIQAVSLLYLTVGGQLTYAAGLPDSSIDHFVFRRSITYSLDIQNNGNNHYDVFLSAELRGLFGIKRSSSETHLLLPATTRHLSSSVPAPVLPGLYTVAYGYRTDFQPAVTRVSRVIYLPPWSIAAVLLLAFAVLRILRIRRHRRVNN